MMTLAMMAIRRTVLAKAAAQYFWEVWTRRLVVTPAIGVVWAAYHKYDTSSQKQ